MWVKKKKENTPGFLQAVGRTIGNHFHDSVFLLQLTLGPGYTVYMLSREVVTVGNRHALQAEVIHHAADSVQPTIKAVNVVFPFLYFFICLPTHSEFICVCAAVISVCLCEHCRGKSTVPAASVSHKAPTPPPPYSRPPCEHFTGWSSSPPSHTPACKHAFVLLQLLQTKHPEFEPRLFSSLHHKRRLLGGRSATELHIINTLNAAFVLVPAVVMHSGWGIQYSTSLRGEIDLIE